MAYPLLILRDSEEFNSIQITYGEGLPPFFATTNNTLASGSESGSCTRRGDDWDMEGFDKCPLPWALVSAEALLFEDLFNLLGY